MHWIIRAAFYRVPAVGDIYILEDDGIEDPFKEHVEVEVIDVRKKFVKYKTISPSWATSMPISSKRKDVFHACYVKKENK